MLAKLSLSSRNPALGLLKPGDLQDEDVTEGWLIFTGIIWLQLAIHTPGGFVSECNAFLSSFFFLQQLTLVDFTALCLCFFFFLHKYRKMNAER